jgi:hypothetical protein
MKTYPVNELVRINYAILITTKYFYKDSFEHIKPMTLVEDVKKICNRLAPHGWCDLLLKHELDITADNLEDELLRELPAIKRNIDGFSDFAAEGKRGIEPGNPARSLLFHAFASPNVTNKANGKDLLGAFPTLAEIETIENYVYGIRAPTIQQLLAQSEGKPIAIVVFATEYRPASETVHKMHADVCFSRTGVCRVGNAEPLYDDARRGFLPFDENNDFGFRVLPAKYSAYVAIQMVGGDGSIFGPMRFIFSGDMFKPDRTRQFWVPLHKLFDGDECIKGLDLKVSLTAHHVNEKIKRIHMRLQRIPEYPKVDDVTLDKPPYKFTTGIAEFSTKPDFGKGLVVPTVHANLIEVAEFQGKPLSFKVPKQVDGNVINVGFPSTLSINPIADTYRRAPEYIHVRQRLGEDGRIEDLNDDENMLNIIRDGEYPAVHFIDFTGDGWIDVACDQLNTDFKLRLPAYSLVTAPDFFPNVDQGELMEWANTSGISELIDPAWSDNLYVLSDQRYAANMELNDQSSMEFPFSNDDSMTAIVSLPIKGRILSPFHLQTQETMRHAYLPDAASGVFAPGWDVSLDNSRGADHLSAYGLGSPFPEDSKLCAALSSYWPAVAPDVSSSFWGNPVPSATVSPLSDEERGQSGGRPWDGAPGPTIINTGGRRQIEYLNFDYVDYVKNMLENKFTLKDTGHVDIGKYKSRILALATAYNVIRQPLHIPTITKKYEWPIISFKEISATDAELKQAQTQADPFGHTVLKEDIYRIEICNIGNVHPDPTGDFKKAIVDIKKKITVFVGSDSHLVGGTVLFRDEDGDWRTLRTQ